MTNSYLLHASFNRHCKTWTNLLIMFNHHWFCRGKLFYNLKYYGLNLHAVGTHLRSNCDFFRLWNLSFLSFRWILIRLELWYNPPIHPYWSWWLLALLTHREALVPTVRRELLNSEWQSHCGVHINKLHEPGSTPLPNASDCIHFYVKWLLLF